MAANAWLQWVLGTPDRGAILLGMMALPNNPGHLTLDFSSLLGALFFTWIAQLLLPVMLSTLVYEKENR